MVNFCTMRPCARAKTEARDYRQLAERGGNEAREGDCRGDIENPKNHNILILIDFTKKNGAAEGTRTPDPIITNDVLYQLSYCGLLLVCASIGPTWPETSALGPSLLREPAYCK
jgi:hypothetical protein